MHKLVAFGFFLLALGSAVAIMAPAGADEIQTERVHFKKGSSGAALSGRIEGRQTTDYVLGAKAGQVMSASLQTGNDALYFNVLPPGSADEAIFVGSTEGNAFSGTLSLDGDYKLRVYLMRSAARRDEQADFTLKVSITGAAQAASPQVSRGSAERAGLGRFDATGQIPCAQSAGQPMGQCAFGVAREASGSATVVVTKPDGAKRTLFFTGGKLTSADTSQADGNAEATASREADLSTVRVGQERYEIPDAVLFGG